jgi:hypothetical protein
LPGERQFYPGSDWQRQKAIASVVVQRRTEVILFEANPAPKTGNIPGPLEHSSKKYRLVLHGDQSDPRVALKQRLDCSAAHPMDIEALLMERMDGRDGHNHITDCAELNDESLFASQLFSSS